MNFVLRSVNFPESGEYCAESGEGGERRPGVPALTHLVENRDFKRKPEKE